MLKVHEFGLECRFYVFPLEMHVAVWLPDECHDGVSVCRMCPRPAAAFDRLSLTCRTHTACCNLDEIVSSWSTRDCRYFPLDLFCLGVTVFVLPWLSSLR